MKLKTLKDLEQEKIDYIQNEFRTQKLTSIDMQEFVEDLFNRERQEAIKWVKEDREQIEEDKEMPQSTRMLMNYLTTKWMRRLDITEEDLK